MAIKLILSGCCGRMGRSIARCAVTDETVVVAAALEASGHEALGCELGQVIGEPGVAVNVTADPRMAMSQGEVVIEFTTPEATVSHALVARELRRPMVIGTTGLSDSQMETLRLIAGAIPVVVSPNMSLGVTVLFELARTAIERLGPGYDVEIVEAHHRAKADAPSGTAKRLASVAASARAGTPGGIPIHAVRAGDIVGEHTVMLAGPAERLELTHRAHSREVFARGALRAARFVVRQPPGLYDMSQVLRAT